VAVEHVDQELWTEFHRVVNMSARELREWLMTRSADEEGAVEPGTQGGVGTPTGEHVLQILGKRRTDLTADDERVMRNVVRRVLDERRDDLEPTAGEAHWRHRLMSMGHDPLKPVS
jgi:Protein of unknown function (DUF3140)